METDKTTERPSPRTTTPTKKIPLFKVHVDVPQAIARIQAVLESGFINEGEQVAEFEEAAKQLCGHPNTIVCNSGTSSLTMAMYLAGVRPGDEVVSTAMTCVATNTPIVNLGAKPIWADIDPETAMITPESVAAKITPKTKAVVCVNWGGTPADLEGLSAVCKIHNIPLIQDAAHALCATYKGKPIAHWADYTCFSFQAIKHITTGDGGALVARSDEKYALAKKLKWFGIDREAAKDDKGNWKGHHWDVDIAADSVGYKFNLNNLSAALGLSQLPHVERIIGTHRRNARLYQRLFEGTAIAPLRVPTGAESSYWVLTCLLKDDRVDREQLLKGLNELGILAGLVHVPNDDYSCFRESKADLPGVRAFSARQLTFPVGWWMTEEDVSFVARSALELCNRLAR